MNPVDALWDVLAETGKAIGDGLTLAAEILCPRDHTAEDRLRSWESAAEAVEDEICEEADQCESAELTPELALGICPTWPCTPACHQSSAAVSAAADPSPADVQAAGDEGPEGASAIPPAAPSGQPTDPGEVTAPSPGEQVSEDDLAAHITAVLVDRPGCFLSDPQIGEFVASDLLADFHITKK